MTTSISRLMTCFSALAMVGAAYYYSPSVWALSDQSGVLGSQLDLSSERALDCRISYQCIGATIEDALSAISRSSGVRLSVAEDVAKRRLSIFTANTRLASVMHAMAQVTGFSWRKRDSQPIGFNLYRSNAAMLREQDAINASTRREEQGRKAQHRAMMDAMKSAIGDSSDRRSVLGDLLGDLTPDELNRAADAAEQRDSIISSNGSHLFDLMLFSTPFNQLGEASRNNVMEALGDFRFDHGTAGTGNELANCQVGIIAQNGSLRLGVVGPDGKRIWTAPEPSIHRAGILGVDSDNDLPPEVTEAILRARITDLSEVPTDQLHCKIKLPLRLSRTSLPVLLQFIGSQSGISIVSDDFIRSRKTTYSWLLTDKDEYILSEALGQIGRAYGHRFVYSQGVLTCSTLSVGLDLRSEPPAELIADLSRTYREKKTLRLDQLLALAKLSPTQLFQMTTGRIAGIPPKLPLFRIHQLQPVLSFYARLTPENRSAAESVDGLRTTQMGLLLQKDFRALTGRGPAGVTSGTEIVRNENLHPGLYICKTEIEGSLKEIHFTLVSADRPRRVTEQLLTLP